MAIGLTCSRLKIVVTSAVALFLFVRLSERSDAAPQLIEGLVNMQFQVSPQLFAVMAAIHVAAIDTETAGQQQSPIHRQLHERLAGIKPDLRERIGKFCSERDTELSIARLQSKYVSLGLIISGPPSFTLAMKTSDLPPDAQALIGFEGLVSELWREADLTTLWEQVRPQYVAEIDAYRPLIRDMIVPTLRYLKTTPRVSLDRQVTFIPELLITGGVVNARNAGHTYIVVVGSSLGSEKPIRSIRHEYLHFLLDPLLAKYVGYLPDEAPFLKRVNEQPEALKLYRQNFYLMVTESLLEMVEMRLDGIREDRQRATVVGAYRKGLILAPYFSDFLSEFERATEPLPVLFQGAIEGIRWEKEEKRSVPIGQAQSETPTEPSRKSEPVGANGEVKEMLISANRHLQSREFDQAAEELEKVIQLDPENASALFGLAQIAGQKQDLENALELYAKAAEQAGQETWIAAWSCVHRGNIYRLQEDYEKARGEWSKALKFQGDLKGAADAAHKALQTSP